MAKAKILSLILSLIIFIIANRSQAQSQTDIEKQFEEIMKAREEMLRSLMDDSFSSDFEKRMQDMIKRFGSGGMDFGFDHMEQYGMGESEWEENSTHRILKLKLTQMKDRPLDIKIQNGMIKIKGDAEVVSGPKNRQSKSIMKFERQFSLPQDVDQDNPEFENKNSEMLIRFKKLGTQFKKPLKTLPQPKNSKPADEKKPITPDGQGLTI
jgi:HSP20 family molecular chaperone IbpA